MLKDDKIPYIMYNHFFFFLIWRGTHLADMGLQGILLVLVDKCLKNSFLFIYTMHVYADDVLTTCDFYFSESLEVVKIGQNY